MSNTVEEETMNVHANIHMTDDTISLPDDPALVALLEWKNCFRAFLAALRSNMDDRCPEFRAIDDAEFAAGQAAAEAIATTPEGLVAQIRFAFYTFGEVSGGGDWQNLADYKPESFNRDGKRLLLSMLAGHECIAGVPVAGLSATATADIVANASEAAWVEYEVRKEKRDTYIHASDLDDDRMDALCNPVRDAEDAIMNAIATTLTDIERKLAVISSWGEDSMIEADIVDGILADVRRLNASDTA